MSRYPRPWLRLLSLLFASCNALLVSSCNDGGTDAPGKSAASSSAPMTLDHTARRPKKTFWVLNSADRCLVYWTEGERQSTSKPLRCPRALVPGEKLRLAGKTCMRHSSQPERNVPVRCPSELFYAERDERAGEGEWKLAPASSASTP